MQVEMSSVVVPKSNKRRINFLLSKVQELSSELRSLETLEEEYEAFRSSKVTKRTKGRPQAKKAVEEEVDLFANLVKEVVSSANEIEGAGNEIEDATVSGENNNNDVSEASVEVPVVSEPAPVSVTSKKEKVVKEKVVKPLKHVLTEEEKSAKKAELEQEKLEKAAAKKLQLEQEKLLKKAQLEQDKLTKVQEKASMAAAEKEAKKIQLEQEKALKKAQIEAEKAAKNQIIYEEKMLAALKKLEAKQFKEMEEKKKKELKAKPSKATKSKASAPAVEEVVAPVEKVTVSRITINDIKYLKSSTNILYNPDTREEVGLYDPETKSIKALPDDDEEEMTEDTYESDDE